MSGEQLYQLSSALPFAIQLDKSTDVAGLSQLLDYVSYMSGASITEDFLFCRLLRITIKAIEALKPVSDFFDGNNLSLRNVTADRTDGVPDKIVNLSWLLAPVK